MHSISKQTLVSSRKYGDYIGLENIKFQGITINIYNTVRFELVLYCTYPAWVTYLRKQRNANSKDCPKMHFAIKLKNDSNQISGNGSFIWPFILNAISGEK